MFHTAIGPIGPGAQPWPVPPGAVYPPELAETLAELRVHPNELNVEQVGFFVPDAAAVDQDEDKRLGSVMKTLAEAATMHSAATWLMEHRDWDLCAVYFDAIDHFCHGFMKYHPPRRDFIPEGAEAAAAAALECIRLHYHYPLAHYVLGLALVRLRIFERARDALTTAVTLNPNFVQAHRVLVRLYTFWIPGQPLKRRQHLEMLRRIRRGDGAAAGTGSDGDPLRELVVEDENAPAGPAPTDPAMAGPAIADAGDAAATAGPEDGGEYVTVVAGLPRSGTSMLMQMLAA